MQAQPLAAVHVSALACHAQASTILAKSDPIDAEAIHQLRVLSKRLRSYWELLQPFVGKSQVKLATKQLQNAASRFAAARDHHVLVTLLGKLAKKAKKPKLQSSLNDVLKAFIESHRTDPPSAESDLPHSGDDDAQIWQLDRRRWESLDFGSDADSVGTRSVRKGLQRIFKKARDLHERAVTEHDIERWHELRKWVKYLSLTIPLCGDEPSTSIVAEEWTRLGKTLGKLHDYDELIKRIGQLGPDQVDNQQSVRATRWLAGKRERICVQCDMHARRLLAQRPGPFAKSLIPD
ncbi:MAG TPA: hypothetical protein DDZ51_05075 [Planctomycetaceae bacterium]|nr:hypothetical protein [Planctomycetaceae bacterium]